ncbi:MAG: putative metal-binding motif-containing protein [Proteobacteria bacterium]|nr:putative metal-binding motif-containing protein [Pseudomonadota bacterium]
MRQVALLLPLCFAVACGGTDEDGDGYNSSVDCNDQDASIHPDADEVCDSWDNDCDGTADVNAVDATIFFRDSDGDGFGDAESQVVTCAAADDLVFEAGDCDDTNADAYPGAPEDCAATADLNCDGSMGQEDNDNDGHAACEECDDSSAAVFPGATEECNGVDDNCDGTIDESACNYGHDADMQPIWDNTCTTRCHSGNRPSADLDLARDAYSAMVSAPSGQARLDIITPGDLDGSYLVHKLRNTHLTVGGSGTRMPKTGAISNADLAMIEAWILDGCAP